MAYTVKEAKPLCTKPEFELVTMAHKSDLAALGPARLRQKITRVRKLRDKFRDESARQRREARGKAAPRATRAAQGNERTVKKAEIFADVLERFEAAFEASRTKAPAAKPAAKKTAKKTTKKTSKKVAKKAAKKSAKKVSKKAARTTPGLSAKAIMKKAGTKVGKKVGKKVSKKKTTKKSASKAPVDMNGPAADSSLPTGVVGTSTPRSAIRAGFRSAGAGRAKGHAVSRSRVAQARRDSK